MYTDLRITLELSVTGSMIAMLVSLGFSIVIMYFSLEKSARQNSHNEFCAMFEKEKKRGRKKKNFSSTMRLRWSIHCTRNILYN